MNLIGFVQAFLVNISVIAGMNDPQTKISPVGFLKMLLENNAMTTVNNLSGLQSGQDKTIKVRYQQRGTVTDVTDVDDCDTPLSAEWKEAEIGKPYFSKIGIFIPDEDMRKYQEEATSTLNVGVPQTPLMMGLYETIISKANGIIQHIDKTLVTAQATKFGVNVTTGDALPVTVNFGSSLELADGMVKLFTDAQANEISDELLICGNGIVNSFDILNKLKTGVDSNGFGAVNTKIYNDMQSVTGWGVNHFGVFGKGTVGFVDFNKNVGSYAGEKGGSMFFTIPVPVQLANGELSTLKFDAQLKYEDCPIFDGEGVKIADRGWKLILSKSYGLFNTPDDAYAVGDVLEGVNGSLHYLGASA